MEITGEIPHNLITSMAIASILFVVAVWLTVLISTRSVAKSFPIGLGLATWYLIIFWLGKIGFFGMTVANIPLIAPAFVILYFTGRSLYRSMYLQEIFATVPLHWAIGVQIFRVMGYGFLSFYWLGLLPGEFAIPTGVGDVIVGLAAPFVAFLYLKGWQKLAIWWNYLGIADLILSLTLGISTYPRPLQLLPTEIPNDLIALFPLVLVPLFAVPLSIFLHLFTLRRLHQAERTT